MGFQGFVEDVVSLLSLEILGSFVGIECMVRNSFYDAILISTLTPIGIALALIGVVAASHIRTDRGLATEEHHGKIKKVTFVLVLWLTYLVLATVSSALFSIYGCQEFDDGDLRLKSSLDISCLSEVHFAFCIYGALMILVYPIG